MLENLIQIMIVVTSVVSKTLTPSKKAKARMFGFLVGVVASPFWFYTAWGHKQYGIFLVSIWIFLNNIRGVYNNRYLAQTELEGHNEEPI